MSNKEAFRAARSQPLRGYGAWDEEQLKDHDENLTRILWLACGDILEELLA